MRRLRSFSFLDEQRVLFRLIAPRGSKVLAYSVLRLAIIESEFESGKRSEQNVKDEEKEEEGISLRFTSGLRELKVVDRRLKPEYLLEACPQLKKLYIDWQNELSEPPFSR